MAETEEIPELPIMVVEGKCCSCQRKTAIFKGLCFWCYIEKFERLKENIVKTGMITKEELEGIWLKENI